MLSPIVRAWSRRSVSCVPIQADFMSRFSNMQVTSLRKCTIWLKHGLSIFFCCTTADITWVAHEQKHVGKQRPKKVASSLRRPVKVCHTCFNTYQIINQAWPSTVFTPKIRSCCCCCCCCCCGCRCRCRCLCRCRCRCCCCCWCCCCLKTCL